MRRFVTYLYEYKDGQKMKNVGHIRVDVRNQIMDMQINIKSSDLENELGVFYIIVRKEKVYGISLGAIAMCNGQYSERKSCDCDEIEELHFALQNIIGVGVQYENGEYIASCWRDGEEDAVAAGGYLEPAEETEEVKMETEQIMAASILEENDEELFLIPEVSTFEVETVYRKINLNEIYVLPSRHWHFSNNSFLVHGFWNYGYLVLKESVEAGEKKLSLGVPGIFEQPEMVMATYFGFPQFQALPTQVVEMEIGDHCQADKKENQQPQVGTFGCWFVDL